MLLSLTRVLVPFAVLGLAMVLGRRAMHFGCALMMLRGFVVCVLWH